MSHSKNQHGFTLIELVITIIILGIIAITSAPKFIDISGDARKSSLKYLKGVIQTQSDLAHIACQVTEGCMNAGWGAVIWVPSLGQKVQMLNGYPDAGEQQRTDQIDDIVQLSGYDIEFPNHTIVRWIIPETENCYVFYRQPLRPGGHPTDNLDPDDPLYVEADVKPVIEVVNTGC